VVTSPDIRELKLFLKHPSSEPSARRIYDAVLGWISVTPGLQRCILGAEAEFPRDV